MMEEQAASRVHRLGQTREVTVNHYIVKDSVEEVSFRSILIRALLTVDFLSESGVCRPAKLKLRSCP